MYSKLPQRNDESGIALISVLWVLLLLSALAASATYITRTNAVLTRHALDLARAESAADAAIVDAISKLADDRSTRRLAIDGSAQTSEFEGIPVSLSISDEAGRIDLNAADDELILAFLQSQGLTSDMASTLLGELRDWRGSGNVAAHSGRNGPLEVPEEVKQIPSWRAQNLSCWMNSLTVYSGLPGVNEIDATPMVRLSLRWAQEHHFRSHDWNSTDKHLTSTSPERSVSGQVLRIRATAVVSKDVKAAREWLGRLTGDRRKPALTMRWDSGSASNDCKLIQRVD